MNERNILFNSKTFFEASSDYKSRINNEIKNYQRDHLLKANANEVIEDLVKKYSFEPLKLLEDKIEITHQGEKEIIDRSWGTHPIKQMVNYYIFAVPFTGHNELFFYQPSTFNLNPPRAEVKDEEIKIYLEHSENNPEELKNSLNKQLGNIKVYMDWINRDAILYNSQIKVLITEEINTRKSKLLEDQKIISSLGFPTRKEKDSISTYVVDFKRKIHVKKPDNRSISVNTEPELEIKEYEFILKTINNMSLVMEQNPKAFAQMEEETLRTHFLVQLNGTYEGNATGETFNSEGKTDILIKYEGKNIFIAECKFWKGPHIIEETINQLLGYLTWRDTKAAILIFNRNKEFSKVLSQIPELIRGHSNYKKEFKKISETEFRFILKNKNDSEREMIVTLLAFNIPQ